MPRRSAGAPFSVDVYQSDRALHLSVRRGHRVVVLGYLGEPFIRIDPAGVWVNAGSPTAAATGLLPRGAPARGWRLQRGRTSVVWHDGRTQQLPPGVSRARWRVPIEVDGRRSAIVGEVWHVRPAPLWPWLAVAALAAALAAALSARRRPVHLRAVSVGFGVLSAVCALVAAAGFALGAYASPGTWIATADEAAFGAAGAAVLAWGPPAGRAAAGAGLGLLGLAVGAYNGAVFLHPIVLSTLPATPTRALVSTAIGAGTAAAVAGVLYYIRLEEPLSRALWSS